MGIKKTSKSSTLKEIEHILVVGLGKSGLSCVNYLTKQIEFKKYISVSYTHLTLPTKRIV